MKKILVSAAVVAMLASAGAAGAQQPPVEELLRQIQQLYEAVAKLKAQADAQKTTPVAAPTDSTGSPQADSTTVTAGYVTLDELPGSPRVSCTLPTLSRGSQGASVSLLQMFLKQNGNYPEGLVTGFYGGLTQTAVKRFQIIYVSGPADGTVYPQTAQTIAQLIGDYFPECKLVSIRAKQEPVVPVTSQAPAVGQQTIINGIQVALDAMPTGRRSADFITGDDINIQWAALPDTRAVYDVTLLSLGGRAWSAAQGFPKATAGGCVQDKVDVICRYIWRLPSDLAVGSYQILVEGGEMGKGGRVARGLSSYFSVAPSEAVATQPASTKLLKVLVPNGGEVWKAGGTYTIQWSVSNVEKIAISECYNSLNLGYVCHEITPAVYASLGSYQWQPDPNALWYPGTGFRIKVSEVGGSTLDESDGMFSVTGDSSAVSTQSKTTTITVTVPKTGDVFTKKNPVKTIEWLFAGAPDAGQYFDVYLVSKGATSKATTIQATDAKYCLSGKCVYPEPGYSGDFASVGYDSTLSDVQVKVESRGTIAGAGYSGLFKVVGNGDVNGDGSTTCTDVWMVMHHSVELTKLTADQARIADVSGDGKAGAYDAALIMQNHGLMCSTGRTVTVWPGDTNDDGVVDERDILPIGVHFNQWGPARSPVSSEWRGQSAQEWVSAKATHVDANGDGVVNDKDKDVVTVNWKRVRNAPTVKVWPGDTNNDGMVDERDILPIGIHWNVRGPARTNASSEWVAQDAQVWEKSAATYADANGDGTVNDLDKDTVNVNWKKTHPVSGASTAGAVYAASAFDAARAQLDAASAALRAILHQIGGR